MPRVSDITFKPIVIPLGQPFLERENGNYYVLAFVVGKGEKAEEAAKERIRKFCEQRKYEMVGKPTLREDGAFWVEVTSPVLKKMDAILDVFDSIPLEENTIDTTK